MTKTIYNPSWQQILLKESNKKKKKKKKSAVTSKENLNSVPNWSCRSNPIPVQTVEIQMRQLKMNSLTKI